MSGKSVSPGQIACNTEAKEKVKGRTEQAGLADLNQCDLNH